MHYITNQNDKIIAADDSLLELLRLESIEELTKETILGNISFTQSTKETISITTNLETLSFESSTSLLSSIIGKLNLISLGTSTVEEEDAPLTFNSEPEQDNKAIDEPRQEDTDVQHLSLDDDLISIKNERMSTIPSIDEEPALTDVDEIGLLDESNSIDEENTEDALLDLKIAQEPEASIDEIPPLQSDDLDQKDAEDVIVDVNTSPITIDVEKISTDIGISPDDYKTFLNEYIDTAISLDDDLRNNDSTKRSSAVLLLVQLSQMLQLPFVDEMMENISSKDSTEQDVELLYATLARFVTSQNPSAEVAPVEEEAAIIEEELFLQEEKVDSKHTPLEPAPLESMPLEPTPLEHTPPEPAPSKHTPSEPRPSADNKSFGSITLDDVIPIHFDFQLEEAATDLSLPPSLIEEFIHDFVEQAHIETKKMLLSYEEGDLDTIQNIAHQLKGASSNLRINALSDTLYKIQFCEDSSNLESYIKQYWGHFLAFEQQIDMMSK